MKDMLQPDPEMYRVPYTTDDFHDMPYTLLGDSGLRASRVGLGTYKFGFPETGDNARVDEDTAMSILDRAVELGVTFWDTANRYNEGSGNSERVIGRWFKKNPDQRRNIVLGTKVFGGMDGRTPNHSRLSRHNILDSVYACLERLQVDHIDLLYFHRYEIDTPIEESLAAVEDLVQRDLVRYLGVSGFTPDQIKLYRAAEKQLSPRTRIIALQNKFNILTGENEDWAGALEYADRQNVSFIGFFPLERGLLTEKYLDKSSVGPGDRLVDEGTLEEDTAGEQMEKVRKLAGLAHEWGWELNQLALAYMLHLPGMGPVIPGCSNVEHLESNAEAGKIELTHEQILKVEEIVDLPVSALD
ncbi:MAG: aldo/keto reductase [Candidatus Bipolaricaulota bacterium]